VTLSHRSLSNSEKKTELIESRANKIVEKKSNSKKNMHHQTKEIRKCQILITNLILFSLFVLKLSFFFSSIPWDFPSNKQQGKFQKKLFVLINRLEKSSIAMDTDSSRVVRSSILKELKSELLKNSVNINEFRKNHKT